MAANRVKRWFHEVFGGIPNLWGGLFVIGWALSLGFELGAPSDSVAIGFSGLYQIFALVVILRKYFQFRRELQFLREFHHLSQTLDDLRLIDQEKPFTRLLEAVVRIAGFDRVILFLVDDEGETAKAEAAFNLPESECKDLVLRRDDFDSIAWEVMDLHEPMVINDPASHPRVHPRIQQLMGTSQYALSPIAGGGVTWGCLLVDRHTSGTPITDDDILQLQVLADQIAITLHNHALHQEIMLKAQLLEDQGQKIRHELSLARLVQDGALLRGSPNGKGYSLASIIRPARFIGGDFFRFLDGCKRGKHLCHSRECPGCPNHLPGVLIGDVCGKGIPAALIMGVVNSLFGEKVMYFSDPARIMTEVNSSLKEYLGADSRFNSTAFLGFFQPQEGNFVYANAGHDFPLFHCMRSDELTQLESTGTLLGIFRESTYSSKEIPYTKGDRIFFYTDGLLECLEEGREDADGLVLLLEFFRQNVRMDAPGLMALLTTQVDAAGTEQPDDITAAVIIAE